LNRSLRDVRFIASLAALAVLLSACVKPDPPTVGMSKIEASLVFGFSEPDKPLLTPIEQVAATVVADAPPAEPVEPAGFELPAFELKKFEIPGEVTTVRPTCPAAPEGAPAGEPALPRVSADPLQGTTRWKTTGFVSNLNADGTKSRSDLRQGLQDRAYRNFTRVTDDVYTFEMVQRSGRDAAFVSTFRVNTAAVNVNPSDGVGTVVTPGVGEPERGITLDRTELVDLRTGQVIESFVPTTGLLLLPLPVVPGETFQSVAVDPRTGQTIVHDSVIRGNIRYDACGEYVDGWLVESTRTVSGTGGLVPGRDEGENPAQDVGTFTYNMAFATQYGGIPIFEQFAVEDETACAACPFSLEYTLGQLTPDPLGS
jgi:hypothetical protein